MMPIGVPSCLHVPSVELYHAFAYSGVHFAGGRSQIHRGAFGQAALGLGGSEAGFGVAVQQRDDPACFLSIPISHGSPPERTCSFGLSRPFDRLRAGPDGAGQEKATAPVSMSYMPPAI
jgi:hypothetical protein